MSGHYTFKIQLIISVLPACKWLLCLCHVLSLLMTLAPQLVSGYYALPYLITAHNSCSWLFSLWVAIMPCHISCLFMPVLGFSDCEWLLYLAIVQACLWYLYLALQEVSGYYVLPYFMPAHDAYSWLSRKWVATLPCNISCLLMMLVLNSPASEWLLCLAIFHACSPVLGSPVCEWLLCLAIFHACSPVLGSPVCEWLLCLTIFHACSWCLFLALQPVSGYFALQYFMPAHDACSWLSSQWVATLPCNISCLLMMLVLGSPASEWLFALQYFMPAHMLAHGSPESEWLLCLAIFHACSWCLFLALQRVSGYFTLQYFMPAHWCLFLALQFVSGYFALQYFMPAHDACSWLSSWWVATLPYNV